MTQELRFPQLWEFAEQLLLNASWHQQTDKEVQEVIDAALYQLRLERVEG